MEAHFDFDKIGKRQPYVTPPRFFDNLERSVWAEVEKQENARRRRELFRRRAAGVAAMAASFAFLLVLVLYGEGMDLQTPRMGRVEAAFCNLCHEDQAYLLEVYQEDIFINQ